MRTDDRSLSDMFDLLGRIHGRVSVIGSMNTDYTVTTERLPKPGETVNAGPLRILPGGKSGNQAAQAALLGANVCMFGAVGSDTNADFLLGELNKSGVDTTHVRHVPGASGTTVITVDACGENMIVYSPGSNAMVDIDYVNASHDVLVASSVLGLCLESPIETVTAAACMCHEAGVTVLLNDSPFVPELPAELIAATDILLVNEHEMAQLLHIDEPDDGDWSSFNWTIAVERLHTFGCDRAIVTLGGDGSVVLDTTVNNAECNPDINAVTVPAFASCFTRIAPVSVQAVDTTGCGDSFMGTVLAGLASGLELHKAARLASVVAAYAATGHGAQASYGTPTHIRERFDM